MAPWDIYIDERKVSGDWALGFLVVPNTASFMHKLWRCRMVPNGRGAKEFRPHEVKWNKPRLDLLHVTEQWIFRVFQHRGVKFFRVPWRPGETKELVVLKFLATFCRIRRLARPYNLVTFLDFDNEHAAVNIQNGIQRASGIARCYHLDSKNNDLLQCADLLLGATSLLWDDPSVNADHSALRSQRSMGQRLTDSQIKRYLAGHLAGHLDEDSRCVYDLRCRRTSADTVSRITPTEA